MGLVLLEDVAPGVCRHKYGAQLVGVLSAQFMHGTRKLTQCI